jgi:hypothetical protein
MRIAGELARYLGAAGVTAAMIAVPLAVAPVASARSEHCHNLKCEERAEAKAHIPHHIHHGVRW